MRAPNREEFFFLPDTIEKIIKTTHITELYFISIPDPGRRQSCGSSCTTSSAPSTARPRRRTCTGESSRSTGRWSDSTYRTSPEDTSTSFQVSALDEPELFLNYTKCGGEEIKQVCADGTGLEERKRISLLCSTQIPL